MTRIIIVGAAGRMGRALVRCAARCPALRVTGAIERPDCPDAGKDAGALAGLDPSGIRIVPDLASVIGNGDVLVDFSAHAAVPGNVRAAAGARKAVVLGATGLTDSEAAAVRDAARTIPIVWSPNMSVGVNLLFALVRNAASALGADYDVEIVEMHHRLKKDSPSGTARRLAEKVAEGRAQSLDAVAVYGRQGDVGERPRGEIGIHAMRGGDVVGDHTVVFANEGERVELSHRASSRDTFAMGALRAAQWIAGRAPGLYDVADVLGLK